MNNLNYLLLEGHLCQDPVSKQVIPGKTVCKFTIAVNRSYLSKPNKNTYINETSFFPVNVWGNLANLCQTYLSAGRGVRIVGHLKQERWEESPEQWRQMVVIIAEHVEFMPEHKKAEEGHLDKETKEVIKANSDPVTVQETQEEINKHLDQMEATDPELKPAQEDTTIAEKLSSEVGEDPIPSEDSDNSVDLDQTGETEHF